MNKRILLSLMTIVAVLGIVSGATLAYFSDWEKNTGNIFASGTLDLSIDPSGSQPYLPLNVTAAKPGDSGAVNLRVKNVGSLSGWLYLDLGDCTNLENECKGPETSASDTSCGAGENQGELGAYLDLTIWFDSNNNGVKDAGELLVKEGKANDLCNLNLRDIPLQSSPTFESPDPGEEWTIGIAWSIHSAVGDIIQSDGFGCSFDFELHQNKL